MSIRAEDDWLGRLFGMWQGFRAGALLPRRTNFDPVELMGMARGRVHIVDTSASTPNGYRFRLWGSSIDQLHGDFTAKCLGDMPPTPMRTAAIEDYGDAVETGYPVYQLVHAVENFMPLSYARLLLPLTMDGRSVTQLLVCINPRAVPEIAVEEPPVLRRRGHLRVV